MIPPYWGSNMSQDQIEAIKASIHALEIRVVKLESLVKIVTVLWTVMTFGLQIYLALRK